MSFSHTHTVGKKTFTIKVWQQGIWYVNVSHNRGQFPGMPSTILATNPKSMLQGIKWANQAIRRHYELYSDMFTS